MKLDVVSEQKMQDPLMSPIASYISCNGNVEAKLQDHGVRLTSVPLGPAVNVSSTGPPVTVASMGLPVLVEPPRISPNGSPNTSPLRRSPSPPVIGCPITSSPAAYFRQVSVPDLASYQHSLHSFPTAPTDFCAGREGSPRVMRRPESPRQVPRTLTLRAPKPFPVPLSTAQVGHSSLDLLDERRQNRGCGAVPRRLLSTGESSSGSATMPVAVSAFGAPDGGSTRVPAPI